MKAIAFIKSYWYFYLGKSVCRLAYLKLGKGYFFDKHFTKAGEWFAEKYQAWMELSGNIQERAKVKGPWNPTMLKIKP